MRHFRAKSQHLDTLAGARSSKVTRYICKFRAVGRLCRKHRRDCALPAQREGGGLGFQVQTFKYRSRISVAKKNMWDTAFADMRPLAPEQKKYYSPDFMTAESGFLKGRVALLGFCKKKPIPFK